MIKIIKTDKGVVVECDAEEIELIRNEMEECFINLGSSKIAVLTALCYTCAECGVKSKVGKGQFMNYISQVWEIFDRDN